LVIGSQFPPFASRIAVSTNDSLQPLYPVPCAPQKVSTI